ncbi:MAG: alanine racemase [Sulfobacillus thermosulfidooxidans]|uniref:Alanine racemase n=1 Tax=Sulfobacillus thermotolerans TaxID=338644 RepID=A0ABN5H1Q4_9FIRM|nr:alanine racemase [Sulfobacillus thermotolerans]MCY0907622.1 alanine racemase [Sulfobacillus thermotolerans]PSR36144.1 MAG: alanine racemase [Sulfobacillus thermosulfidooxidans]
MRPTIARIYLDRLQHNVSWILNRLNPHVQLMAVVKADGYGHGAVPVAQAALSAGASYLGVALVGEGVALRNAGIDAPILVLGQPAAQEVTEALDNQLDLVVFDPERFAQIEEAAKKRQRPARVHLKMDTGMGRIGMLPAHLDDAWIERLRSPHVILAGLMTHFANADASDPLLTQHQVAVFLDIAERLRQASIEPLLMHAANSAAALKYPGTQFSMVRVGIAMYGLEAYHPMPKGLRPVMELISTVTFVKDVDEGFAVGYGSTFVTDRPMKIITVPIGYADGYRRALSNRAQVLIRGHRYPVVGRISMDQLSVGADAAAPIHVGDPVVLIGESGGLTVTADDLAREADTIGYEIVTGISARVPRVYGD